MSTLTSSPPKSETLASAGIVSLLGSAFGALAAMALTVIIGRGAGANATGLFFQAVGLFTIATQVLKLGSNSGLIRQISVDRAHKRRGYELRTILIALVPVTVISIGMSLIFYYGAAYIAALASSPGEDVGLADTIRILAPFVGCAAVLGVLQSATRMVNSAAMFVLLQNVLLPLSRLVTVLIAILASASVGGLFFSWAAPLPLWLVVTVALLARPLARDVRRRSGPAQRLCPDVVRFWRFTAPRGVGAALEVGLDWSDVLIVAALTSPREAGIYAVITRVVKAGQVVDRAMRISVSPRISHHLSLGNVTAARHLHTRVARAMILATWPFYLVLATMGRSVLGFFGAEFTSGVFVLALYSITMMGAASAGMLQSVLLMGGRSSWQVYIKALSLLISVTGNLLLVPHWGIAGAAATWAFVIVVDNLIAATLVHRGMGVAIQVKKVLPAGLIPLLIYGMPGIVVGLLLPSGPAVFFPYLLLASGAYAGILWRFQTRLGVEEVWVALRLRRGGVH